MTRLRPHQAIHTLPMRQQDQVKEIKRGRTRIEYAPDPGTPKSAQTPENIDKVEDIVLAERRVKVREIVEAVGISIDPEHFILHHESYMNILYTRQVPRLFTLEQKQNRMRTSAECSQLFKVECKSHPRTNSRVPWGAVELCCF